jgi:hypothetical protein
MIEYVARMSSMTTRTTSAPSSSAAKTAAVLPKTVPLLSGGTRLQNIDMVVLKMRTHAVPLSSSRDRHHDGAFAPFAAQSFDCQRENRVINCVRGCGRRKTGCGRIHRGRTRVCRILVIRLRHHVWLYGWFSHRLAKDDSTYTLLT